MSHDLLSHLALCPGRAAILLRHAERGHIAHPASGHDVVLTPKGESDSLDLGCALAARGPLVVAHSPVPRCRQTAESLVAGAVRMGGDARVLGPDGGLGGPYLVDAPAALDVAGRLADRFVREWFDGNVGAHLIWSRRVAAMHHARLVRRYLASHPHAHVILVTHDWNLLTVREEFLGLRHEEHGWPAFLEPVVFWSEDQQLRATRGHSTALLSVEDA